MRVLQWLLHPCWLPSNTCPHKLHTTCLTDLSKCNPSINQVTFAAAIKIARSLIKLLPWHGCITISLTLSRDPREYYYLGYASHTWSVSPGLFYLNLACIITSLICFLYCVLYLSMATFPGTCLPHLGAVRAV